MNIYISIDGVLRNLIEKFGHHYVDNYLTSESEDDNFVYRAQKIVYNDDLKKYFDFKSIDEYKNFLYLDFVLEIFGHSNVSYQQVFNDLNNFIYENKHHTISVVGLDELGKSKPSTLFFLSKNGLLGDNVKFVLSEDIPIEWGKIDVWITDNEKIIKKCPKNKLAIKFNTKHNSYFTNKIEINKLTEIDKLWLKSLEKNTLSILTDLVSRVKLTTHLMMSLVRKLQKLIFSNMKY